MSSGLSADVAANWNEPPSAAVGHDFEDSRQVIGIMKAVQPGQEVSRQ